jgi:uncharacterized membrane protein
MKIPSTLALIAMIALVGMGCEAVYTDAYRAAKSNYFHGTKQFIASDGEANDKFGCSVAVSADGSTIVAGAYNDNIDGNGDQGSAYVYRWNGSEWVEKRITASDGEASDLFGYSVAVSADGCTVVAGANGDDIDGNLNQGSVYVYRWNGSSWIETKLTASDGLGADQYGTSVSVSADGTALVVGAMYGDGEEGNSGSAYVYRWNGSSWMETKITANDGKQSDRFGRSVAMSADGDTIVVGANMKEGNALHSGSAYVYRWNGLSWIEDKLIASDGEENDWSGTNVAISANGNTVVVSVHMDDDNGVDSGSAYVYRWNGSEWIRTKITASDGEAGDWFGWSVAISADGSTIAAGAYGVDIDGKVEQGSAYVYRRNGSSWVEIKKITANDGKENDRFGRSIAISADGSTIVVGAFDGDGIVADTGLVWLYAE